MGFSVSSIIPYQLKSVSLRTNEKFVRLYNDVTEARRLYLQRSRDDQNILGVLDSLEFQRITHGEWKRFQDKIWDVDQRMKRVEMNALFSEVVPEIMLQLEQIICPVLRDFRLCYEGEVIYLPNFGVDFHLCDQKLVLKALVIVFAEYVSWRHESAFKALVSALALLSFVCECLTGCVDKGGSKTYSPGSFLFRLIFVAIVLFLGSYVWIKFRQASYTASRRKRKLGDESDVPGVVYCRAVKNTRGSVTHFKYEPRFKPLREKVESGGSLEFNFLSLGSYDTHREAEIVLLIAAVLYGEVEGRPVEFEDGLWLPFPFVTELENCPPCGKEKAVWVTCKTKELYAKLVEEKARRLQPLHPAVETGSHHGYAGEASRRGPSPSAPGAPSTPMELTYLPSPLGSNGVVEQPTTSESHGLGQEALLAREVFSPFFSDSAVDQAISSMPVLQEHDLPAMDEMGQIGGDNSETDRVFGFESLLIPSPLRASDNPTPAVFGSLPQLGVGDQGLKIIEPHLNSATAIPFQRLESLPEQVQLQQHVAYQEQRPEEFSGSVVELQQKLREYEERNSKLQRELRISEVGKLEQEQELRQAKVENENLRSMFHQVVKLISASDLFKHPVDL